MQTAASTRRSSAPRSRPREVALLDELADVVRELPQEGISAVGFGIPSRVDQKTGVVLGAVNIPIHEVNFRSELERRLELAGRDRERRQRSRLRRVQARSGPRRLGPRAAHAWHRRRRRHRHRRLALPWLGRARPRGDRRGRRAVPRRLLRARSRRGVLLGPGSRRAREARARRRRDGARPRRAAASGARRGRAPPRSRDRLARQHLPSADGRGRRRLRCRGVRPAPAVCAARRADRGARTRRPAARDRAGDPRGAGRPDRCRAGRVRGLS